VDAWQRVVRADFSGHPVSPQDEEYILTLFEDADTTVIIKGLASNLRPGLTGVRGGSFVFGALPLLSISKAQGYLHPCRLARYTS
jgi:hypothetical protein